MECDGWIVSVRECPAFDKGGKAEKQSLHHQRHGLAGLLKDSNSFTEDTTASLVTAGKDHMGRMVRSRGAGEGRGWTIY